MFWVMRQPTCVFARDRADSRLPGDGPEIADSALSALPSTLPADRTEPSEGTGSFSFLLYPPRPPACPAGTIGAVPFRVAVTRRARRNTFQGERKVERRNASKTQARCTSGASEPPAHVHALPGARARARLDLSAGLSFALATRGTGAPGAGSSAARPATRPRPRAVCGATGPHPPPAPPAPRSDRERARVYGR